MTLNIMAAAKTVTMVKTLLIFFFPYQEAEININFTALGLAMAAISFGLIGLLMTGAAFFGEQAEHAKRTWLPTTIQGLILIGITSFIITVLTDAIPEEE